MADIKISELEPTTDLEGLYTIGSDKNNLSKKVSLQFLKDAANYANEQGDYAKQAGDTVNGNVGVSDYPEFSASQSYVIGDIVRYNGVLYSFTANHAASAWNNSDVKATSINAITSGKLTELEVKAYINAKIFEGNGWGDVQPYVMYPNYKYEFINIGNNPIMAVDADYGHTQLEFPASLEGGKSVIITPPHQVGVMRFYFNGESSILVRAIIEVDKEILDIKEDYNNRIESLSSAINNGLEFIDTPYANPELMQEKENFIPLAIKSIQISAPSNMALPNLGVLYIWKNLNGNSLIRISENGAMWKDWSIDNYVPSNPSMDIITIGKDGIVVQLIVDWDLVADGVQWAGELIIKASSYNIYDDAVIKDADGTMANFIDGIIDAKYLATSYIESKNQVFALTYFWKNYGDNKTTLIRVGQIAPNVIEPYAQLILQNVNDGIEEYILNDGQFYFKIDWSKVPNGTAWSGRAELESVLVGIEQVYDGYTTKDSTKIQVWVSQDGTKDYTSIGEAYAAISDSSYENQYEVIVLPGTYDEYNLIPPPFTHTYGLYPNTVKITSRKWSNIGDTLPVFDQRTHPSKLSNLTIESWTGYCIHFDVEMNNVSIKNENLHLIKQYYDGAMMAIIGGGSYKYGARYEWKSCIFECVGADGNASCHTQANSSGDNTFLLFDSCSFIRCAPSIGSVGAWGKCTCEITNCNFGYGQSGLDSWFSPIRSVDNPNEYLANRMEWGVVGGGNKNFAPRALNTIDTIRIKADYPIEISGSAVDAIFGNNYKTNDHHSARIQCSVTSMYYIDDSQAGLSGYSEVRDVYQLWKRLGDCSSVNKTLSVTINGVTKSYTFTKNYLSSKQSEDSIIAEMQSALNHCTIEKYSDSNVCYELINTTDKMFIEVADDDILAGEFITKDGKRATSETNPSYIAGMVVGDTTKGNFAPVWTNAIYVEEYTGSGDIGLNDIGELYWTGKDKPVGFIKNRIFYPYY